MYILKHKNLFNNDTDFEEKFTFDNYITDETGKKINDTCPEELEMNYESLFEEDDYFEEFEPGK